MQKNYLLLLLITLLCGCQQKAEIKTFENDFVYDGLLSFYLVKDSEGKYDEMSNEFHIINQKGEVVAQSINLNANTETDAKTLVAPAVFSDGLAYIATEGKYIDKNGETKLELKDYNAIKGSPFWENRAFLMDYDNYKYIVIDTTGKVIFEQPYNINGYKPESFCKDGVIVFTDNTTGKSKLLDQDGNLLLDTKDKSYYLMRNSYHFGVLIAFEADKINEDENNYRFGAIDITGEVVIPFKYNYLSLVDNNGLISAELNGKYGLLDTHGHTVVDFTSDYPLLMCDAGTYYETSRIMPEYRGKYINLSGEAVDKSKYDFNVKNGGDRFNIPLPNGNYIGVAEGDVWGGKRIALFDEQGNMLTDPNTKYCIGLLTRKTSYLDALEKYMYYDVPYVDYLNLICY